MASESLIDVVKSLSPEEQASVLEFIDYLKRQNATHRDRHFYRLPIGSSQITPSFCGAWASDNLLDFG